MTARQCIATLCFVAFLPSCMTFKAHEGVPPGNEGQVRVTLHGGSQVLLTDAQRMDGHYVGGLDGRTWFVGCENCAVRSIPIDSIATFEVNEVNPGGTVWAIILTAAVGAFVIVGLAAGAYESGGY